MLEDATGAGASSENLGGLQKDVNHHHILRALTHFPARRLFSELASHEGAVFDNASPLPGDRIAVIRAPTLIVHGDDDSLHLYDNATFGAAAIPELAFKSGFLRLRVLGKLRFALFRQQAGRRTGTCISLSQGLEWLWMLE